MAHQNRYWLPQEADWAVESSGGFGRLDVRADTPHHIAHRSLLA
jgi:hypothetical protein